LISCARLNATQLDHLSAFELTNDYVKLSTVFRQ